MIIEKKVFKNVNSELLKLAVKCLENWFENRSYNSFEVIVTLYELNNNAMKYSQDEIDIILKLYPHSIVIRVNDHGKGFNAKKRLEISSYDMKKNLIKPNGRGIYIVKNFVSKIYYNKKGNNVVVKINEDK